MLDHCSVSYNNIIYNEIYPFTNEEYVHTAYHE
jgi:hypothetical protein